MTLFTELVNIEAGELVVEDGRSCLLDGRGDTYVEPCGSKSIATYCFAYNKQLYCFSYSKDHKNSGLPYIIMILDHNSGLPSVLLWSASKSPESKDTLDCYDL